MCEPLTIALIASTVVSAAATGVGALQQQAAAKYQERVAEANADQAQRAAIVEETRFRRELRDRQGALLAEQGATGLTLDSVSPLVAFADQAGELEQDAFLIRAGGSQRVANYRNQASLARFQANAALISGSLGVGADLLSGATQLAGLNPTGGGASAPRPPVGPI